MTNSIKTILVKVCINLLTLGISFNSFAHSHIDPDTKNKISTQPVSGQSNSLNKTLSSRQQQKQFTYDVQTLSELNLPYNDRVVSSKGASDLWRLIPSTAKQFNISNRDHLPLECSTTIALHHFNVVQQKFKNWQFAIAAYAIV